MEVVSGVHDEAAAVEQRAPTLTSPRGGGEVRVLGNRSAALDQAGGDVAKNYVALRADTIERPEADQAIAAADVEDGVAGLECRAVEDAIASSLQVLDEVGRKVGAALATLANPERPAIFRRRGFGDYR